MRFVRLALGLALLGPAACAKPPQPSPPPAARGSAAVVPGAASPSVSPIPIHVETHGRNGEYVTIVETSHRRKVYTIRALSGEMQRNGTNEATGDLEQPHVTFIDKTGAKTIADAPKAHSSERDKSVVMTGGVHARTSAGIVLTCDTLRYDARSERLHGAGNVQLHAPNGVDMAGDDIDGDVKLQDVKITRGRR
jgi:Lipopolysaccharide-assembly, LptC-related